MSTEARLQLSISCGRLSVLMRKRNVLLFPSVPYLNHLSAPFSSSLHLALRMQPNNRFFTQVYTFFAHQISSLVSYTSFFGPKKRPGTTTHLGWFQGIVQHLCGTYSRVVYKGYPTDFGTHFLQILDQVVRSSDCLNLRPTQRKARLPKRHGAC